MMSVHGCPSHMRAFIMLGPRISKNNRLIKLSERLVTLGIIWGPIRAPLKSDKDPLRYVSGVMLRGVSEKPSIVLP